MSTSKSAPPGGPASGNPGTANPSPTNPYARFIPREELGSFAAWNPQSFERPAGEQGGPGADTGVRKPTFAERAAASATPPMSAKPSVKPATAPGPVAGKTEKPAEKPSNVKSIRRQPLVGGMPGDEAPIINEPEQAAPAGPSVDELVNNALKQGYQDGYRNGLSALETYKQTQGAELAAYMTNQIETLAADFHHRLESLEQQLAGRIAGVALEVARQVVRSEITQRPDAVLTVAEEALGVLLTSARQVVVRMNPDDQAMAQGALTEVLQARGARLQPDPTITRGGVIVESDIAVIDASVEDRWYRAAAAMGSQAEWRAGHEMPYTPLVIDEDDGIDGHLPPTGAFE